VTGGFGDACWRNLRKAALQPGRLDCRPGRQGPRSALGQDRARVDAVDDPGSKDQGAPRVRRAGVLHAWSDCVT